LRLALAALTVAALAGDASAYVRNRTSRGVPVAWPGSCVFIQPDSAGSPDLPSDVVFATIQKSMQNWLAGDSTCSYLKLMYDDPAPLEAHLDGKNIVKFRTDRWCHPDDQQEHGICYSSIATGITTVFFIDSGKSDDGTIMDADIELNDLNFTFVVEPTSTGGRPGTEISDLENTLTHELGHVQGLDHTCKDTATTPQEVDENGNVPPSCALLSQLPADQQSKIENATMFNSATPGETKKRMPSADDVAGICAAYPTAKDPMVCKRTNLSDYASCSIAGRGSRSLGLFALVMIALATLLLRRPRRGH
jgi:hypothetical protein